MKRIKLNGKYGAGKYALVDDNLYDILNQWSWRLTGFGYVIRTNHVNLPERHPVTIFMHLAVAHINGVIMPDQKYDLDHKDGNPLNNQVSNLRPARRSQNIYNSVVRRDSKSGYKGVHLKKANGRYYAKIKIDGKLYSLGGYADPEEAAYVWDQFAVVIHGEFARLNVL